MMRQEIAPVDAASVLYTASDVARFCQVDLKTIHNWAEKGEIKHFRTPGRHLRFRRGDVVDFLRKWGYPMPTGLRGEKPRVVVLDEDASALSGIRRALAKEFDVLTFQEAVDALLSVGATPPDLFVVDVGSKTLDGVRCIERIRGAAASSSVRCVAWGAREEARDAALRAGALGFVKKGDTLALRDTLAQAVAADR